MTAPDGSSPDGSLGVGGFAAWQATTENDAKAGMKGAVIGSWTGAETEYHNQVRDPLGGAITNAGTALTEAQAAVNAAANAESKADTAYTLATEWSVEFVVASAEVTEGAGELLVGPMVKVRDGRDSLLTDIHMALLEQVDGLTVETRIWNKEGTEYRVAHTAELVPDQTRYSRSGLDIFVGDEERFFPYVVDIVGTVPPTVLQIHLAGVYIDEAEEEV